MKETLFWADGGASLDARASSSERGDEPTYDEVEDLLEQNSAAYADGRIAETVLKQASEIATVMEAVPGFQGAFFTGYPFYALGKDGLAQTPTILRFSQSMQQLLANNKDNAHRDFGICWPCADCQDHGGLAGAGDGISGYCLPCVRTPLRPRQLFRTLPDVDTFLLFDKVTSETEQLVAKTIEKNGMRYCEANIRQSYAEAKAYFGGDDTRLPIDLHLLAGDDYIAACQKIATDLSLTSSVPTRTLFLRWHTRNIDVGSDLLFSATPMGKVRPEILDAMLGARRALAEAYVAPEIVKILGPRMQELIAGNPGVAAVFSQRLDDWHTS